MLDKNKKMDIIIGNELVVENDIVLKTQQIYDFTYKLYEVSSEADYTKRQIVDKTTSVAQNYLSNVERYLDFVDTKLSKYIENNIPDDIYCFGRINNAYLKKEIFEIAEKPNQSYYICKTSSPKDSQLFEKMRMCSYRNENCFYIYYFTSEINCQKFITEINNENFDLFETFESYTIKNYEVTSVKKSKKNKKNKMSAQQHIDTMCRYHFKDFFQKFISGDEYININPVSKIKVVKSSEKNCKTYYYGFVREYPSGINKKITILRLCAELGINTKLIVDCEAKQHLIIYGNVEQLLKLHENTNCFAVLKTV